MILQRKMVDLLHHLEKTSGRLASALVGEAFLQDVAAAAAERLAGGEWLRHSRIDLSK